MEIRAQKILAAIVKEYSETATPVGSKELVDKYRFQESSATIRSEMADLEKAGFIFQPHKSAGRVPTDKGYRIYVDSLIELQRLGSVKTQFSGRRFVEQGKLVE